MDPEQLARFTAAAQEVAGFSASLPGVLEDLQRKEAEARQQVTALQAEKDELELKLAVAKSDRAAAVANLQGEVASLQSRLSRANKAAKEAQEQARAAEGRLAEAASAAEAAAGASRDEEAGLRQRLQAAEALAQQQAQQLEVLHGKVAQAEQAHQEQLAQERQAHAEEVALLRQERDAALERCKQQKKRSKEIVFEYNSLKAAYRRQKRELAAAHQKGEQRRGSEGEGEAAAAAAAAGAPGAAASESTRSDEDANDSQPLFLSEQISTQRRQTSISSMEAHAPAQQQQQQPQQPQQQQQQPQQPQQQQQQQHLAAQRHRGEAASPHAAAANSPSGQLRSPVPPAIADPPPADAWAAVAVPQAVPPTNIDDLPASDDDDDVDATQAVPPPAAPVICTQLPPPPPPRQQQQQPAWQAQAQQHQQQQHSSPGWRGTRAAKRPPASGVQLMGPPAPRKRQQLEAGVQPAAALPREQEEVQGQAARQGSGDVEREAEQSAGSGEAGQRRRRRQQQQFPSDDDWSPVQGQHPAAAQPPPALGRPPDWGQGQPQQQPGASGWPGGGEAQQAPARPQLPPGGGWKQVARASNPVHAAFDLGAGGYGPAGGPQQQAYRQQHAPQQPVGGQGASGSRPAPPGSDTGYKYQAVIRKKAEREKLQGVECQQCKGFYEALESWGTATGQQQVRLACGHVQQQGAAPPLVREQLRQEGSRHRYQWQPPATQEGFWNMDITQEPPPPQEQPQHDEALSPPPQQQQQAQAPVQEVLVWKAPTTAGEEYGGEGGQEQWRQGSEDDPWH